MITTDFQELLQQVPPSRRSSVEAFTTDKDGTVKAHYQMPEIGGEAWMSDSQYLIGNIGIDVSKAWRDSLVTQQGFNKLVPLIIIAMIAVIGMAAYASFHFR